MNIQQPEANLNHTWEDGSTPPTGYGIGIMIKIEWEGSMIKHFARATGWQRTCSTAMFELKQTSSPAKISLKAVPTLVVNVSDSRVNKLHEGPMPIPKTDDLFPFWTFIASWGGNWMWQDITNPYKPKDDMQWVADGMTAGTLIWTTNGSYDRKQAVDLSGVGWIIICTATGQRLTGSVIANR
jgi:hypothetical protein